jgi:hypothetical protein
MNRCVPLVFQVGSLRHYLEGLSIAHVSCNGAGGGCVGEQQLDLGTAVEDRSGISASVLCNATGASFACTCKDIVSIWRV